MGRVSDAWNRAEAESLEVVGGPAEVRQPLPNPLSAPSAPPPHDLSTDEVKEFAAGIRTQPTPFPREWNPDRRRLVFLTDNGNGRCETIAEQFRSVSSQLYKIRQARPMASVLVSSTLSQEGRTFVAANLGHALAQQPDKRILLIDGDMRKPVLHKYLGTRADPGLSEYLAGKVDASEIIQRGSIRGLFFIPSGGATLDPAELLANGRFRGLILRAGLFDWIIIDSPPSSVVPDASIIAEACDGVLFVVEATRTPSVLAEKAVQQFGGRPILGAVINRSDLFHSYKKSARQTQN